MTNEQTTQKVFNKDVHGKEYNRAFLIISLMVGAFISVLNQTVLSTALPNLMKYFNVTASTVQWVTTAFMLANAIMIPLTALLLEKVSTKKLFMSSMIIFTIGTIICGFSSSFEILLVGRIVQAIGAGIIMPLINTVLLLIFPPEKRGAAMGLYGLVVLFAPAIGPTLAGLIIDNWNWHYLFYMLLPIIAIDLVLVLFFMKDIVPSKKLKIDFLSIVLSSIGLGSMLYGFSSAGNKGWSDSIVIISIIAGFIICALFIFRQLKMKIPMLEFRVFESKLFTLTTIIGSILNIAFVGGGILLPIYLQNILGKSAFYSGLVLLPGALMMAILSLISGKLFDKHGIKKLAIPGLILMIIGSSPFVDLHRTTSPMFITIVYSIRYLGIGLMLMPLQTAGMNALPNKLLPHASAVVNMSKQVAGSIGTAILITFMSNIVKSEAPSKVLAKTNLPLYKSKILDATLSGIDTTFIIVLALIVICLIMSFFINESHRLNKTA